MSDLKLINNHLQITAGHFRSDEWPPDGSMQVTELRLAWVSLTSFARLS